MKEERKSKKGKEGGMKEVGSGNWSRLKMPNVLC